MHGAGDKLRQGRFWGSVQNTPITKRFIPHHEGTPPVGRRPGWRRREHPRRGSPGGAANMSRLPVHRGTAAKLPIRRYRTITPMRGEPNREEFQAMQPLRRVGGPIAGPIRSIKGLPRPASRHSRLRSLRRAGLRGRSCRAHLQCCARRQRCERCGS